MSVRRRRRLGQRPRPWIAALAFVALHACSGAAPAGDEAVTLDTDTDAVGDFDAADEDVGPLADAGEDTIAPPDDAQPTDATDAAEADTAAPADSVEPPDTADLDADADADTETHEDADTDGDAGTDADTAEPIDTAGPSDATPTDTTSADTAPVALIDIPSCDLGTGYFVAVSEPPPEYLGDALVVSFDVDFEAPLLGLTRWRLHLARPDGPPLVLRFSGIGPPPAFPLGARLTYLAVRQPGNPDGHYLAIWAADGALTLFSTAWQGDAPYQPPACPVAFCPWVDFVREGPCWIDEGRTNCQSATPRLALHLPGVDVAGPTRSRVPTLGGFAVILESAYYQGCGSLAPSRGALFARPDESGCRCFVQGDCADGAVCDNVPGFTVGRCLEDRCVDTICADGVCDRFTGACVATDGLEACAGLAPGECVAGGCDVGTHTCIALDYDQCTGEPVCGLARGVPDGDCFVDCDCPVGRCVDGVCDACDEDRVGFDRDNPDGFELVQLCVPHDPLATAAAEALFDDLHCGYAASFTPCAPGEQACYGVIAPGGATVDDAEWRQLCRLSFHPLVSAIAGGFIE